ncbi:MAG TPA: 50S ribosomal protein L35 [Candidatus Faeciplasma pullistercoris]|uniref:Large ribosomal subunit protein bL35 n=1 Tax=Candidatus Faeciplasma pullistercoris TaxID=2840800 RepID=A0A9D1GV90_9FIRM|nr:50S ribosomal protein L35 [Candidatus Faeciplasma pullistercoris]
MAKIKVKTHSGTKKRFSLTGTGKVKFQHAYKRHRLVSKDHKAKRIARGAAYASSANVEAIKKTIPYK